MKYYIHVWYNYIYFFFVKIFLEKKIYLLVTVRFSLKFKILLCDVFKIS